MSTCQLGKNQKTLTDIKFEFYQGIAKITIKQAAGSTMRFVLKPMLK